MAFHLRCWPHPVEAGTNHFHATRESICQGCGSPINPGEPIKWYRTGFGANKGSKRARREARMQSATTSTFASSTSTETESTPMTSAPPMNTSTSPMTTSTMTTAPDLGALGAALGPLLAALAPTIAPALLAQIAPTIEAQIAEALSKINGNLPQIKINEVTIRDVPEGPPQSAGVQHKSFATLLRLCAARINTWLAGPAGSGKTTAAREVAKALGLPFYYVPAFGDSFAVMGYCDATGKYVRTSAREAFEHGGIVLFDEVDACCPNATLALNALIENGVAAFPDGMIQKHRDCVIIAAANTWGHGGNAEYVGRNKLDAAFIDRFAFLAWDYDTDLEMALAPNKEWCARVQAVRKRAAEKGIRVVITPRATIKGGLALAAGMSQEEVEMLFLRKGMSDAQWRDVSAA